MNQETDHPQTMPEVKVLDQLNEAFYQVYIFRAALEMEVFAKVATGEDTSEQMAAKEGWDPVGTRMLLDDLCCLKLLERDGPRYRLVPESECYLLPEKPAYWGRLHVGIQLGRKRRLGGGNPHRQASHSIQRYDARGG